MRLIVTSGDKHVEIHIKGKSQQKLRAAEDAAHRLLTAAPDPEPGRPFGYAATSDTELADQE